MALPPLFKYYTGQHGLSLLKKLQLKVTPPNQMNDVRELSASTKPVDREYLQDAMNSANKRSIWQAMIKKGDTDYSYAPFDAFMTEATPVLMKHAGPHFDQEFRDLMANILSRFRSKFGLLCLTANEDHPLMWGHYGGGHAGMLIEFNVEHAYFQNPPMFHRVTYSTDSARFDPARPADFEKFALSIICTKQDSWRYENEWRAIYRLIDCTAIGRGKKALYFTDVPHDVISGVVLGAKCPPKTEHVVRKSLAGAVTSMRLRRAKQDPDGIQYVDF